MFRYCSSTVHRILFIYCSSYTTDISFFLVSQDGRKPLAIDLWMLYVYVTQFLVIHILVEAFYEIEDDEATQSSYLPPGCKPLGCKWILKKKMKVDGTIDKFKARLVIQGFRQKEGIDYFDTYALVARISIIRLLIALASTYNLVIHQMDVKTTFLNGDLEEEVYMKQPEGFIMPGYKHKVLVDVNSIGNLWTARYNVFTNQYYDGRRTYSMFGVNALHCQSLVLCGAENATQNDVAVRNIEEINARLFIMVGREFLLRSMSRLIAPPSYYKGISWLFSGACSSQMRNEEWKATSM
ncbi:zinc finger, CCHC-type containing protein [Tanacetum coccineum]